MPIGKGYFWEGLSSGVRGLYGSMQNERMAKEAQDERSRERDLGNAAKLQQIKAAMGAKPAPDTLNPDYDAISFSLKSAQKALADHDSDFITKSQDPVGWSTKHAELANGVDSLSKTEAAMRAKVTARHGVNGSTQKAPPKDADAEFMKNLFK